MKLPKPPDPLKLNPRHHENGLEFGVSFNLPDDPERVIVQIRIGIQQGETNVTQLTASETRQLAYLLLATAERAEETAARTADTNP